MEIFLKCYFEHINNDRLWNTAYIYNIYIFIYILQNPPQSIFMTKVKVILNYDNCLFENSMTSNILF